jgi:hypothetical protein
VVVNATMRKAQLFTIDKIGYNRLFRLVPESIVEDVYPSRY